MTVTRPPDVEVWYRSSFCNTTDAIRAGDAALSSMQGMLCRAATEVVDLMYQISGEEYDQDQFEKDVDSYLRKLAGGEL